MSAELSAATFPLGLVDPIRGSSVPGHPSLDHQVVLSKSETPEIETHLVCFPEFTALPFELRARIWQLALPEPDYQNVVIVGGRPRHDLRPARNSLNYHNGKSIYGTNVSYRIPAILHTCQESRAVGHKKYPTCFREQLGIPILFNLSKDLLLFTDVYLFFDFLGRSLNTFGANDNGLTNDLRFLGICGALALDSQPLLYNLTCSRLPRFYNLEELILENDRAFPCEYLRAAFVDNLKNTWTDRRQKAPKELRGSVSGYEAKLPKISFLCSEEIKRLANADPLTRL